MVASANQITTLLDEGHSYETAGRQLGISPGLAFMIATGMPADGTVSQPDELAGNRGLRGSSQHLVNPPPFNPTRKQHVVDWVKQRAKRELTKPG